MNSIIISEIDKGVIDKLKLFIEKLPAPERSRPIISLENKLFSWEDILEEFKKGGELANKLLNILKEKSK